MPQDYPDDMSSVMPGNNVELDPGFTLPWYEGDSVTVLTNDTDSVTFDFLNPDFIYFVDMLSVSPEVYKEFAVIVELRDIPCVSAAGIGWLNIPLRQNPSMSFVAGDTLTVSVTNLDASTRTFAVKLHGTKIIRPDTYGHAPGAYYVQPARLLAVGADLTLTDASSDEPTSYEWDFKDGSEVITTNPGVHHYDGMCEVYPRLKAINDYGYDTWCCPLAILVYETIPLNGFTETDPASDITIAGEAITITTMSQTANAFVVKDYGVGRFGAIAFLQKVKLTALATASSRVYLLSFANVATGVYNVNGVQVNLYFYNSAGEYRLYAQCVVDNSDVSSDYMVINLNTDYYLLIERAALGTTLTVNVYSDADYSTFVDTLLITHASVATQFRYLYPMSCRHDDVAASSSLVIGYTRETVLEV